MRVVFNLQLKLVLVPSSDDLILTLHNFLRVAFLTKWNILQHLSLKVSEKNTSDLLRFLVPVHASDFAVTPTDQKR